MSILHLPDYATVLPFAPHIESKKEQRARELKLDPPQTFWDLGYVGRVSEIVQAIMSDEVPSNISSTEAHMIRYLLEKAKLQQRSRQDHIEAHDVPDRGYIESVLDNLLEATGMTEHQIKMRALIPIGKDNIGEHDDSVLKKIYPGERSLIQLCLNLSLEPLGVMSYIRNKYYQIMPGGVFALDIEHIHDARVLGTRNGLIISTLTQGKKI